MKKSSILFLFALLAFGQTTWAQQQETVSYISRWWNGSNVVDEVQTTTNYIELTGTDATRELTMESYTYYVVKGTDVRYQRLIAPYGAAAKLILCDCAKLTSQITIEEDQYGYQQKLEIFAQSGGTGQLVAKSVSIVISGSAIQGCYTAGIGSSGRAHMGELTIHGGIITADASNFDQSLAAGIGGGGWWSNNIIRKNNGGNVTIYGGTVTATGNHYAAGIGGGAIELYETDTYYGSDGGSLKVYGGTVNATGGNYGAGIGGSYGRNNGGDGGTFEIWGGTVTARGVLGSAGIGAGENGNGGTTIIHGGTVYAYGGTTGAGIGCGGQSSGSHHGGTVTIHNGTVDAYGGDYGAGIGGGRDCNGGTITINGGTVTAHGGTDAAGIGCGEQGSGDKNGGTITINGGSVYAYGGKHGAGIGGGQDASGANVTVNDGYVYADGGIDGAGIGSGEETTTGPNTNGGTLTVYGGHIFADGTDKGCGIGAGEDSDGATVYLYGGIVEAWCGNGSRTAAFGSEDGDGHRGDIIFGNNMMVHAGSSPTSTLSLFDANLRKSACWYRDYARIEPCNHEGATYTINGTDYNGTHTLRCTHCLSGGTAETHTFENEVCTVCHVHGDIDTVSVYMPVYDSEHNTYSYGDTYTYRVQLVTGSSFELPVPQAAYMPAGVRFVGWRIGSPSDLHLTNPQVGENEDLLLAGESYTVNGDVSLTSRYNTFDVFTTAGDWNVASNWSWGIPSGDKEILIAAAATIPNGYTAQTGNNLTIDLEGSLTIADGGQLIHSNASVVATVQKQIGAFASNGWKMIASPLSGSNDFPTNLLTNGYIYKYDEASHFWRSNTGSAPFTQLTNKVGYLYGNDGTLMLEFTGELVPSNSEVTRSDLSYTSTNGDLAGWNLVGNPFACNAYVNKDYYIAEYDATAGENVKTKFTAKTRSEALAPCTGILVKATSEDNTVKFSTTSYAKATNGHHGNIQVAVARQMLDRNSASTSAATVDNAIVSFNEGERLEKFVFNENNAKLYIPQDGRDFAIVTSEGQGELPVNFEATEDGTYTLTVNPENVELAYLHLIDNMTGADVDVLASPTYSFTAKTSDYASRFRLVFSVCGDADGDNAFAFISNGNIIVTNASVDAVLQIVDMMGRVIVSRDAKSCVSTSGMPAGVYVLRLINGDDIKTQKIVVR